MANRSSFCSDYALILWWLRFHIAMSVSSFCRVCWSSFCGDCSHFALILWLVCSHSAVTIYSFVMTMSSFRNKTKHILQRVCPNFVVTVPMLQWLHHYFAVNVSSICCKGDLISLWTATSFSVKVAPFVASRSLILRDPRSLLLN